MTTSNNLPFDTMEFIERFTNAGIPREQAKVHISTLVEVIAAERENMSEHYATKVDSEKALTDLKTSIDRLQSSLTHAQELLLEKMEKTAAQTNQRITETNSATKWQIIGWVLSIGVIQAATGYWLKILG